MSEPEEHTVTCANCDERATALVKPRTDQIFRILCTHCGYVEERS